MHAAADVVSRLLTACGRYTKPQGSSQTRAHRQKSERKPHQELNRLNRNKQFEIATDSVMGEVKLGLEK